MRATWTITKWLSYSDAKGKFLIRCLHHNLNPAMLQSKISEFFASPLRQKETGENVKKAPNNNSTEPTAKKRKTTVEANFSKESEHSESKLSQTDQQRMEQNKLSAKLKLLGNKTNGLVVNFGPSWFKALEPEFSKEYFLKLSQFVAEARKKGTVYPPPEQVFTWTLACPIESVKVVIIGQDPYHGPKQAHGLCFSVLPGIKPPPSLENMYKELESDIPGFKTPDHGNLIGWAQQGVLLLNACLTVQAGQANSHAGQGWEKFTDAVIQWINTNLTGVVFLLWGAYAQKKGASINKKKHHILTTVHPSPLSAHRGFFGCKHFSQCNGLLKGGGQKSIDWKHLPEKAES